MAVQQPDLAQLQSGGNTQIIFSNATSLTSNALFTYNVAPPDGQTNNLGVQLLVGGVTNTGFGVALNNLTCMRLLTQNINGCIQLEFSNDSVNVSNSYGFIYTSLSEFRHVMANGAQFTFDEYFLNPLGNQGQRMAIRSNGSVAIPGSPTINTETRAVTGLSTFMTANTQRTSLTSLASGGEANLLITINETGVYKVDALITLSSGNSNCGMNIDFQGGSSTISQMRLFTTGIVQSAIFIGQGSTSNTIPVSSINSFANNGLSVQIFSGIVTLTTTGTFGPRIAQFVSTATPMNVVSNSYVTMTKIG